MAAASLERASERVGHLAAESGFLAALLSEVDRTGERARRAAQPADSRCSSTVLAEAERNPAVAEILRQHSQRRRLLLAELIRKGQAAGEFDAALEPERAAAIIIGLLDGIKTLAVRDPAAELGAATAMFRLMVSRFLAPQGAGRTGAGA